MPRSSRSASGPMSTTTPRKPSAKPPALARLKRSPRTKKWASTNVVIGITAMKMPARPLSIFCWPQLMSQNGAQFPTSAMAMKKRDLHRKVPKGEGRK